MRRVPALFTVVLAALFLLPVSFGAAAGGAATDAVLVNNVLRTISHLTPVGPTDPAKVIGIGVGLTGANPSGEAAFLQAVYDPASPQYQQFLDPDTYEQQFGVPLTRLNQAVTWLTAGGLKVQTIPGSSEYLIASGTVAQVGKLLHVSFSNYQAGTLAFYANTTAPTVPAELQIYGISGLNSLEGPRLSTNRPATPSPSMDVNLTTPSTLWSVYDQPSNNKGEGQQMAIFGWGTTNNTVDDLRQFEAEYQLPGMPVSISYYGTESAVTDSAGEGEWDIDTQASTGMAPNATGEKLYFAKAGTDPDLLAAYNAWAADKKGPLQGSSSFSGCEEAPGTDGLNGSPSSPSGLIIAGNPNEDLYEAVLRKAVAEGRTMFASTGDTGSGCPAVSAVVNGVTLVPTPMMGYPAISSYAVGVGGTVLYFNDATATTPASRAFEYSWTHTGGGTSQFIAAGAYQNTNPPILLFHCVTDAHGNPYPIPPPLCRGNPDVAAQSGDIATNGYTVTMSGQKDQSGGGTSLSSPLWLGMWTRVQAASSANKGLGFANPTFYRLGSNAATGARDFFDIGGANADTAPTCNGPAPDNCSHLGWDYTSGWGAPDVTKLMQDADGRTAPVKVTTPNPPPAPAPLTGPTGTSCPGPQIVDATGDAPNNYPSGDGSNMDGLDIVSSTLSMPNASTLRVTMAIKNLQAPPPPANMLSGIWTVHFVIGGVGYDAQATSNGTGSTALYSFFAGPEGNESAITGTATPGAYTGGTAGTIVMDVPVSLIGGATPTAVEGAFADSDGAFTLVGTGLHYVALADRAPDKGYGAGYYPPTCA